MRLATTYRHLHIYILKIQILCQPILSIMTVFFTPTYQDKLQTYLKAMLILKNKAENTSKLLEIDIRKPKLFEIYIILILKAVYF